MELFIGLMFWSIVCAAIFLIKKSIKFKKVVYIILVYIPLILISGLRNWNVGTDTILFHKWYAATANVDILDFGWYYNLLEGLDLEWGFVWIGYLFNIFDLDAQVMIFVYSTITVLGMAYAFYKYSTSLWLSTFLYIALFSYAESLNIAKQSVATMIMLNAFGYLQNDYKFKYFKMIVLSMVFHFSSIVYGLILLLMPIKFKKSICLLIFFCIIGFLGWNFILIFAETFSIKYIAYFDTDYIMARSLGPGIIQILGIIICLIISYFLYKKKKFNLKEEKEVVICSIFMIALIFITYFQYVINIIYRFTPYAFVYLYILIPLIINKMTETSLVIKFIIYSAVIIAGFIYCMICINLGWHEIIPYSFCF